ncbi:hypothetical protein CRE_24537 [Caenorhabditis remanei]|uniref:Uncharacterized protein n=2 Tax=Caenorhabditis remanei TaxID=31234 RepID=E3MV99_CAERE|nr:hypothetical protein CRE_24537 [Caenorhabditis remanei]
MSVVMSTEEALRRLDEAVNVIKTSNTMLADMIRTQKQKNGLRRLAIRDQREKDEQFAEAAISIFGAAIIMITFAAIFVLIKY